MGKSFLMAVKISIISVIIYPCGAVLGHPHVFISPKVTLRMEGYNIKKAGIRWVFDRMTSNSMMEYLDRDSDGKLSEKETRHIKKEVFPSLSKYDYYTFIRIDGEPIKNPEPVNFEIFLSEKNKLEYRFDFTINKNVKERVSMVFEDSTIYTAFDFSAGSVKLLGPGGEKLDLPIEEVDSDYSTKVVVEF